MAEFLRSARPGFIGGVAFVFAAVLTFIASYFMVLDLRGQLADDFKDFALAMAGDIAVLDRLEGDPGRTNALLGFEKRVTPWPDVQHDECVSRIADWQLGGGGGHTLGCNSLPASLKKPGLWHVPSVMAPGSLPSAMPA